MRAEAVLALGIVTLTKMLMNGPGNPGSRSRKSDVLRLFELVERLT